MLQRWTDYCKEIRECQGLKLPAKDHIFILLGENPVDVWRTVDELDEESGLGFARTIFALRQLVDSGQVVSTILFKKGEDKQCYALKGRTSYRPIVDGVNQVSDYLCSDLEKILTAASSRLREAISLNEQIEQLSR